MITIVGGSYREVCLSPSWNQVYGSGGRAASAISGLAATRNQVVELHTFIDRECHEELQNVAAAFGFDVHASPRLRAIEFQYDYPLGVPRTLPDSQLIQHEGYLAVKADAALVFGMMEASPRVTSKRLVYDPQSGTSSLPFSMSGHTADEVSIVANLGEVRSMANRLSGCPEGNDPAQLGVHLLENGLVDVVVVKDGANGAIVVTAAGTTIIPCYGTQSVFSIGSGDVFSAAYLWKWAICGDHPHGAADFASRATAHYCDTSTLPIPIDLLDQSKDLVPLEYIPLGVAGRQVYLAGPLFTVSELWLLAECRRCLENFGLRVFSPKDEVGILGEDGDPSLIAAADIAGLATSDCVFAILDGLDPGTLFEIGYARAKGIPVICLAHKVQSKDLTMIIGSGCEVCTDVTSALYRTAWRARSR